MGRRPSTPEQIRLRFWSKVHMSEDCWEWTAGRYPTGYGGFWDGTAMAYCHRYAWEDAVGPIPQDMTVDHVVCSNRICVRPSHMEIVTRGENARRGLHKRHGTVQPSR